LKVLRLEVSEGRGSSYARMALYLIDNLFKASFKEPVPPAVPNPGYNDKKENKIFLIHREIQMGSGAKSYMRKGFLTYEEMQKYFHHI
jgi:hypothetical protein